MNRILNRSVRSISFSRVYLSEAAPRVPSYYDRYINHAPPDPVSVTESKELCENINEAISQKKQNFAIVYIGGEQYRVTDHDLVEVPVDWNIEPNQRIKLEKVIMVGSEDFTLAGRPIVPRNIATVDAICVAVNYTESPRVTFYNPRAPRRPGTDFIREKKVILRIEKVSVKPNLS